MYIFKQIKIYNFIPNFKINETLFVKYNLKLYFCIPTKLIKMVAFDEKGNPKPYDVFTESLIDFEKQFIYNDHRKNIYDYFNKYLTDIKKLVGETNFEQWIDGSFTTTKKNPNDIDVISIIPHHCETGKTHLFYRFRPEDDVKSKYGNVVDAYLIFKYPENDIRYELTKDFLKHFKKTFSLDRSDNPKGIICLEH